MTTSSITAAASTHSTARARKPKFRLLRWSDRVAALMGCAVATTGLAAALMFPNTEAFAAPSASPSAAPSTAQRQPTTEAKDASTQAYVRADGVTVLPRVVIRGKRSVAHTHNPTGRAVAQTQA